MSRCFGCYFHHSGWMYNGCDYFETENYPEPEDCLAFSVDGNVSDENEAKLFELTGGVFGKPGQARRLMEEAPEVDAVPVIRCKDCVHYQRWITGMYCTVHDWRSKKNDYCSRAEKLK